MKKMKFLTLLLFSFSLLTILFSFSLSNDCLYTQNDLINFSVEKVNQPTLRPLQMDCCKEGVDEPAAYGATVIKFNEDNSAQYLSDFFKLDGFILLEETSSCKMHSDKDNKLLVVADKLLVLDNATDFQDVWVFDKYNGTFSGKMGFQSENDEKGYDGLNDIAYDERNNLIRFCASSKMAFMDYSPESGSLVNTKSSGIIGEEIEWLNGGKEMVAYNEFNANEISGSNYLVFYDREGNLLKKALPYSPALNGSGYNFTGFLSKSAKHLFFAPPFSDTLFEIISKDKIEPRYVFNFGAKAIPENLRTRKIYGENVHENAYLSNQCIQAGRFLIVEYFNQGIVSLGLYDTVKDKFTGFNQFKKEALSSLLRIGELTGIDENTFAFAVSPARLKYLIKSKAMDEYAANQISPGLWEKINQGAGQEKNMLILYFKVNPEAVLM